MTDIRNDFINAFVPDQDKMADWFEGYVKNLLLEAQKKELNNLKAPKGRFTTSAYGLWVDHAIDTRIKELKGDIE